MTARPLWWDGIPPVHRPALTDDTTVDVCIVGAGFTGLWSAYYLLRTDPTLSVLVVDAEHVGFGASGRNGGWVSALYPTPPERLAAAHGDAAARDQYAALRESVTEVGRVVAAEGIDCGFHRGGTVVVARSRAQLSRARAEVAHAEHWGLGVEFLERDAARERLAATGTLGATYNPHCGRVQPRRLVNGVASAVERLGGRIAESTRVTSIEPRVARTAAGPTIRARNIIRATEAWTSHLPGSTRQVAPVYSLIVATEPLGADQWSRIGLAGAETFSEHRHVIVYGQRSVDGRLVFGGRGAPYHFRSGIRPGFDEDPRVFEILRSALRQMFPVLNDVQFTHAWGGALGIPRDWQPGVGFDPATGLGWSGGYVGDGVALSNLGGRTVAELVTGRHTAIAELPWVQHRSRHWEPEPLRWLGINAGLQVANWADHEERLTHRPARLGKVLSFLTGH
ncbi:NAD(P)/FAD-dependent oxidoreductase [Flexivirga oryzae]|uniref:Glycine/D-amino acid oxidase-like deaminating enzyme n=1 Tax=Flexivirga oryzae TaxID=1794944 RepID=A0A839N980_9MICO|nr:FAD-dependent oxidoreductase [Flexivirga oryzae]MBB2893777.1 glycine/D-amino acid oxidase-like deaminating enzyme [Flexivirga oryzae]